jgi:hypothetical protein
MGEGPQMAMYSPACTNWDAPVAADRYGAMLSTASGLPVTSAAIIPFVSGAQMQRDVLSLRHMSGWIAFCRDGGAGGRVTLGPAVRARNSSRTRQRPARKHLSLISAH